MAILNSILRGQLKGRLGSVYFSHARNSKGQPVTRAGSINSSPTNPKTYEQMRQRARFANSVKFYTRATKNFFRFAYEDKKANETDYNAFMRHNINSSLILSKTLINDEIFPAIGDKWQLSYGSLVRKDMSYIDYNGEGSVRFFPGVEGKTIGEMSQYLIENANCRKGDIITYVLVSSGVNINVLSDLSNVEYPPFWNIYQFIVNPNDTTDFSEVERTGVGGWKFYYFDTANQYYLFLDNLYWSIWSACVVTRQDKNKLMATTSFLRPQGMSQQITSHYQTDDMISAALESWGATDSAILKGGVATRSGTSSSNESSPYFKVTSVNGSTPPLTVSMSVSNSKPITVIGSNLVETAPVSSNTKAFTVSNFVLNSDHTQATFNLTNVANAGNSSITYNNVTIITAKQEDSADA